MAQTVPARGLQRGERNYRLATVAVLAAGLAVFNGLYVTQAMLPALVDAFETTPTVAALTVSVATGMLAICVALSSLARPRWPWLSSRKSSTTASFFAAHSIASGWVGALAEHNRAEASSMYVLCYYLGSSVVGALSGLVFTALPWWGFVGTLALLAGAMLALGIFAHAKETPNAD